MPLSTGVFPSDSLVLAWITRSCNLRAVQIPRVRGVTSPTIATAIALRTNWDGGGVLADTWGFSLACQGPMPIHPA